MKKWINKILISFALLSFFANTIHAALLVKCIGGHSGALPCQSIISEDSEKEVTDGIIFVKPQEEIRFASKVKCDFGNYDLFIKNLSEPRKPLKSDASEFEKINYEMRVFEQTPEFQLTIVKYKRGNRNKPKKKTKSKFEDIGFATVTGRLSFQKNNEGLACSVTNKF